MHPRLYRLIETHARIDRQLRAERARPWRDPFRLVRLNNLKLRAKDLIHRFNARNTRRPRHAMS